MKTILLMMGLMFISGNSWALKFYDHTDNMPSIARVIVDPNGVSCGNTYRSENKLLHCGFGVDGCSPWQGFTQGAFGWRCSDDYH